MAQPGLQHRSNPKTNKLNKEKNSVRINATDSLCSDRDRSRFARMRFGRFVVPTFD